MKRVLALLLFARVASAYTIIGGESDVSSSLWWFIPAAGCVAGVPSSNWDMGSVDIPVAACAAGTNVTKGRLIFNDGTGTNIVAPAIEQMLLLPQAPTPATAAYVTNGPLTVTLFWTAGSITGNVRWCAQILCRGDGELDDAVAYDTAVCTDDAAKGSVALLNLATIVLAGTASDTCAPNELLHLKVYRDSDHANDTMTGDASLMSVTVAWPRFQ